MPIVVLIDTSVLLNILNIPGRNQDYSVVVGQYRQYVKQGATLLLPFATVIETGNHVARIVDGAQRRRFAITFAGEVANAMEGNAPWRPMEFPDARDVVEWMTDFPDEAMRGRSLADLSIIKNWTRTCDKFPRARVLIWSLDQHLAGFDRDAGSRR